MSRLEDVEAAKEALRVLARVVKTTHDTFLQAIVHPTQQPTPEQQHHFSDTLDHIRSQLVDGRSLSAAHVERLTGWGYLWNRPNLS